MRDYATLISEKSPILPPKSSPNFWKIPSDTSRSRSTISDRLARQLAAVATVDDCDLLRHSLIQTNAEIDRLASMTTTMDESDGRTSVRIASYMELNKFKNRWGKAVREDECWVDPFHQPS